MQDAHRDGSLAVTRIALALVLSLGCSEYVCTWSPPVPAATERECRLHAAAAHGIGWEMYARECVRALGHEQVCVEVAP